MLKLVKFDASYAAQLTDMIDEWTGANEKIIPWAIRKCDYHDLKAYADNLEVKNASEGYVPDSTFFLSRYGTESLCGCGEHPALLE